MQSRKTAAEIAAAVVATLLLCGVAHAAQLYRWTDADGRVVYGDKPPKGAKNVTPIEVDTQTTTIPSRRAPAPSAAPAEPAAAAPDLLTQRRLTRARLEENLAQARARLDLARKNLAEATDMAPEEQQTIIERVETPPPDPKAPANPANTVDPGQMQVARGGMHGMSPNRMNCSTVRGKDKKPVTICPTIIPNAAYRERIAALEDAVRKAEEDVRAAEEAYRRGVD